MTFAGSGSFVTSAGVGDGEVESGIAGIGGGVAESGFGIGVAGAGLGNRIAGISRRIGGSGSSGSSGVGPEVVGSLVGIVTNLPSRFASFSIGDGRPSRGSFAEVLGAVFFGKPFR